MPLDISKVKNNLLPFEVSFGEAGSLRGQWDPTMVNPHVLRQLREADEAQVASAVCDLVVDWDMQNAGEAIPPTAPAVTNKVPWTVTRDVAKELLRQIGEAEKSKK